MTPDLEAAERELAEALCKDNNALLRVFVDNPFLVADNPSMRATYSYALIKFAARYELARRERERQQNSATV